MCIWPQGEIQNWEDHLFPHSEEDSLQSDQVHGSRTRFLSPHPKSTTGTRHSPCSTFHTPHRRTHRGCCAPTIRRNTLQAIFFFAYKVRHLYPVLGHHPCQKCLHKTWQFFHLHNSATDSEGWLGWWSGREEWRAWIDSICGIGRSLSGPSPRIQLHLGIFLISINWLVDFKYCYFLSNCIHLTSLLILVIIQSDRVDGRGEAKGGCDFIAFSSCRIATT